MFFGYEEEYKLIKISQYWDFINEMYELYGDFNQEDMLDGDFSFDDDLNDSTDLDDYI